MKDQAGFSMPWLGKFVRCVPRRSVARRVSLILTLGLAAGLFSHPAGAAWGPPYQQRSLAAPPSQDWLKDAPERPHRMMAVIRGPSSRVTERPTRSAT